MLHTGRDTYPTASWEASCQKMGGCVFLRKALGLDPCKVDADAGQDEDRRSFRRREKRRKPLRSSLEKR